MMEELECPNCGARMPTFAKFCGKCGHVIESEKHESLEELSSKIKRVENDFKELREKYEEKEREIESLKRRLEASESSKPKFGGNVEIYCKRCKKNHTIPYIPGKYYLCGGGFSSPDIVRINSQGEIKVSEESIEDL